MAIYKSFGQLIEPGDDLPSQVLIFMLRESYPSNEDFVRELEGLGYSLDYSAKNISYILFIGKDNSINIPVRAGIPLYVYSYADGGGGSTVFSVEMRAKKVVK